MLKTSVLEQLQGRQELQQVCSHPLFSENSTMRNPIQHLYAYLCTPPQNTYVRHECVFSMQLRYFLTSCASE